MATVGHVAAVDHDVGLGHPGLHVALGDAAERGVVAVADERRDGAVLRPAVVHQRGVGGETGLDVGDRRQRFVLDDDGVHRPLGRGRIDCGDGGDDLAFEPDDVAGEERAVLDEPAVPHIGNIVGGQHGEHTGDLACRGHVQVGDPCAADVRVAELGGQHAGEGEVGGVAAAAGDLVGAVGADEAGCGGGVHVLLVRLMMADQVATPARPPSSAPWRRPTARRISAAPPTAASVSTVITVASAFSAGVEPARDAE